MSISPAIILISKNSVPLSGNHYERGHLPDATPAICLSTEKFADIAEFFEDRLGNFLQTSLIFASSESAYTSGVDATQRTETLKKAFIEIFKDTEGEIGFKTIDNPLPQIENLEDAKNLSSISPYVLVKKAHLLNEDALKKLKALPDVEIIDHGNFYEISFSKNPFGKTLFTEEKENSIPKGNKLDLYYSSIRKAINETTI